MKKHLFAILCFANLWISCTNPTPPQVAFYYWKTQFRLSESEQQTLHENHVKKLYIRYFDLVKSDKQVCYPESPIHFQTATNNYDIVPVVYIQNKVFINQQDVVALARKTFDFIDQINQKNAITCHEIQLDCDWTLQTKENYLAFIEAFKKISHQSLSATIRLHQVKYYKKTKIPSVNSGVLMYYNMGKIAPDEQNSIYNQKVAQKYIQHLDTYPLQLRLALPIFSWGIQIRDGKIIGLINKINDNDIEKDSNFVKIKPHFYTIKQSVYQNGRFYRSGDVLKIEKITENDLENMIADLKNQHFEPKEIIFYDLDEKNTINYEKNIYQKLAHRMY